MDHEQLELFEEIKQKVSILNPNLRVILHDSILHTTRDQIVNRNEQSRLKRLKEQQDIINEYFISLIEKTDAKYVHDLKEKSSFIKEQIFNMEHKFHVKEAIIHKRIKEILEDNDEFRKKYIEIRNKKFEKLCDEMDNFLDLEIEDFYNKYAKHKCADPMDELHTTCSEEYL